MSTHKWARNLVQHAEAQLLETDLIVTATCDLSEVPSALSAGHLVLTTRPPEIEVPTWTEMEATWELYVIAGHPEDHIAAWKDLDTVLFKLLEPLAVEKVRPDAFTDLQGATYPALVLTTTSHRTRSDLP